LFLSVQLSQTLCTPFYNINTMAKFTFGERKIVGVNYSRYVGLPKVWLKNHRLDANDRVTLDLGADGALIVRPVEEGGDA